MNIFKVKKFRKPQKADGEEKHASEKPLPEAEEPKPENGGSGGNDQCKLANSDPATEAEDDDDDFITNEVKRRLKELRRNSFMVLIPEEESCQEEEEEEQEEEGVTSPNQWRDVEAEGQQWWRGFDAVFEKYCERMLLFDRMSTQQLNEVGKGIYIYIFFCSLSKIKT